MATLLLAANSGRAEYIETIQQHHNDHDKLLDELEKLAKDKATLEEKKDKLQAYIDHKKEALEGKLEEIAETYNVATGDVYQEVVAEEAKNMIEKGIEGAKDYISEKSQYKKLADATVAIAEQGASLEKIYAELEKFSGAEEALAKQLKDAETIQKQITSAEDKIDNIDNFALPVMDALIADANAKVAEATKKAEAVVQKVQLSCQAWESSSRITTQSCRAQKWQVCSKAPDGSSSCTYGSDCFIQRTSQCISPPPYKLCSCPTIVYPEEFIENCSC